MGPGYGPETRGCRERGLEEDQQGVSVWMSELVGGKGGVVVVLWSGRGGRAKG